VKLSVRVQEDHLRRLVTSDPVAGVAELIWNALDADADHVRVRIAETAIGGVEEVVVEDDGHGMTFQGAQQDFQRLGGSWKRRGMKSMGGTRVLHGSEGKGRWRAFAIGDEVVWTSVAEQPDGSRKRITLRGVSQQLGEFELSDPVPTDDPLGTIVSVAPGARMPTRLLADATHLELTTRLALYLQRYPSIEVIYQGQQLSPDALQARRDDFPLEVETEHGPARLVVIEWTEPVDRGLFLCDENGTALEQTTVNIHAPGFQFTAYVCWAGFREHENVLLVADFAGEQVGPVVEAAREKIRDHFKQRMLERSGSIVDQWKAEQVYPYKGEPGNHAEQLERDLFDIVAVAAAPAVNTEGAPRTSKRFALRLLKQALEENPGSLSRGPRSRRSPGGGGRAFPLGVDRCAIPWQRSAPASSRLPPVV
jgi:Histidine kinase-, DNA gyrase B-, and HSP90-like ATPase